MRRVLLLGAVVGAAVGVRRLRCGCARTDFERRIERLPEGSPRRWMAENIRAIRRDTERIRELLEHERADAPDRAAHTAA